eukprot:SAG31_NODE_1078_length_10032_cov_4.602034_4_plen_65_part_00
MSPVEPFFGELFRDLCNRIQRSDETFAFVGLIRQPPDCCRDAVQFEQSKWQWGRVIRCGKIERL